jgi:hypothetical protein
VLGRGVRGALRSDHHGQIRMVVAGVVVGAEDNCGQQAALSPVHMWRYSKAEMLRTGGGPSA